jgi:LPXTG-motif cell wall-anchored protein
MKRILIVVTGAVLALAATATGALAQYPPTARPPTDPGSASGGGTGGALPFTGASISWWLVILAALVLTGVVLLFMGRRRRVQ